MALLPPVDLTRLVIIAPHRHRPVAVVPRKDHPPRVRVRVRVRFRFRLRVRVMLRVTVKVRLTNPNPNPVRVRVRLTNPSPKSNPPLALGECGEGFFHRAIARAVRLPGYGQAQGQGQGWGWGQASR